jgi:transcriptional antiterminator RfaH
LNLIICSTLEHALRYSELSALKGGKRVLDHHPQWFAVYTKPRQEQIALQHLQRQGFKCFLPMAINPYQRRSQKSTRIEPLFPRYLFLNVAAGLQSLGSVRSTRGVSTLVRFGADLAHIPEAVIRAIRSRCEAGTGLVRLDPAPVGPGDQVRVFDGPLAGVNGLFQARSGEQRALLLVQMMGRETKVEVDCMLLQKTG